MKDLYIDILRHKRFLNNAILDRNYDVINIYLNSNTRPRHIQIIIYRTNRLITLLIQFKIYINQLPSRNIIFIEEYIESIDETI